METCQAEARICSIQQGKWPVVEYTQELCSLVACLRKWFEPLLVYQFLDGLNRGLYHNGLPWGRCPITSGHGISWPLMWS